MGVTTGHPFSENNFFRNNYLFTFPVHLAFKLSLRDRVRNFSTQPNHSGLLRVWAQGQTDRRPHVDPTLRPLSAVHRTALWGRATQEPQGRPPQTSLSRRPVWFLDRQADKGTAFLPWPTGPQIPCFLPLVSVRLSLSNPLLRRPWVRLNIPAVPWVL